VGNIGKNIDRDQNYRDEAFASKLAIFIDLGKEIQSAIYQSSLLSHKITSSGQVTS
jgi:hypothetical protein